MSIFVRSEFVPESFGITHQGTVRDHNEDAFLDNKEQGFWVVADGAGGHDAGEVASQLIVDTLAEQKRSRLLGNFSHRLVKSLQEINAELFEMSGGVETSRLIASTVSVLMIQRSSVICLWSGDSRIYLYRQGKLSRLTRDHNRVDEFISAGFSREDAENYPLAQYLTAAVGAGPDLHTELQSYEAKEGDLFLLCSDGLYKELDDSTIAELLVQKSSIRERAQSLLDAALANKARDNVTVLLVALSS